jgi:hypothetical protein
MQSEISTPSVHSTGSISVPTQSCRRLAQNEQQTSFTLMEF